MSLRAVLLLAILLPCVPVCFYRPFFGIIMWTIISFGNPHWYAWGANGYFPTAELIAIPTLLGFGLRMPGMRRIMSRESLLMVALWAWFTVTCFVAQDTPLLAPHATLMWAKWQMVTKIILMSLVTVAVVDSFERLRLLVKVTAFCFTFYVVKAIPFIITTGGSYRLYGPPHSMLEDNNDLGLALNMTLPLVFFLAQTETNRHLKKLFWFLFAVTIPGIFMTYSRGALVGLVAVIAMLFARIRQRLLLVPVLVLGILFAALFAPDAWRKRMDFSDDNTLMDASALSRINAWTFAWRLTNDFPITGGGFETFSRDLFPRYAPNGWDVHGPHSIYFGIMAEHGFVGFGLYFLLVGSCFYTTAKIIRRSRQYEDEVAAAYARMFQLSLVGFLTSGLFLGRAYFDYYFAIVACVAVFQDVCFRAWSEGVTLTEKRAIEFEESGADQYVAPANV